MQIKTSEVDYGKLVFYFRTKNELTQQELSLGICSITYLSKVENSKINPNQETLALLLNRLDIDISEVNSSTKCIARNLELWYQAILQREKRGAVDEYKKSIDKDIENVHSTDLIFYYYLVNLRYNLHKKNLKEIESNLETLHKSKEKLNSHQKAYFEYFSGIFDCTIKSDFQKGLKRFENLIPFFNDSQHEDPEFFFHLSLTYTNTYNTRIAITYGEMALSIFNNKLLFKRSLECQLLLGVNYGRLKEFSKATEIFKQIKDAASGLNDEGMKIKSLHNLGYMNRMMKNYNESIHYYSEVLNHIDSQTETYLNVIIELASVLKENKQDRDALKWVNHILNDKEKSESISDKIIQLSIIKYQILGREVELIDYLERIALPKFTELNKVGLLTNYYETLGKSYKKLNQYKKSSYYFEQCLQLTKQMS